LIVVQPDTVVRWHRQWLRRRWTQRSRQTRPGRPSTTAAIRTLVDKMGTANPLWGAPRIHGELGKLGIEVSQRTVSRLLRRRRRRPPSQTWRTFLTNHVTSLVSMDFFTVPTLTGRVLFVLVLLAHHRRRVVHLAITEHPTAAWTAQQIINAFPDDTAPRWLLRDRDTIYGDVFQRRVAGMGITEVISSPIKSLAKSVCGEADWINQARLPEPRGGIRRAAFAPSPNRLPCVLSRIANSPLVGERRANAPTRAGRHRG
jgi:putative transposase